eukprot:CAMPEP_0119122056 /NCGR_PEP_ID=MMETSP1310-20130426/2432_1 /TAXON_ID=464262 /ORGANISM="Genus nov. species nov., Strain RCC2339" /LENGTH=848 /DNA_ID=CAMNT_0007111661 /DNA_START=106 /DNA_END=2652 /DNA_ORIENTATION=+
MKKKFGFLKSKKESDFVLERSESSSASSLDASASANDRDDGAAPSALQQEDVYGVVLWAFDGANEGEIEVPEGAEVRILEEVEEWLDVEYEGNQGYIPRAYVEIVEAAGEEPGDMEEHPSPAGVSAAGLPNEGSSAQVASAGSGGVPAEPLDPAEEGRKQICYEILSTEENFVQSLGYITDNYKAALEALAEDETSGLDKSDVKKMFANIESITTLNRSLLQQLNERLAVWNNATVKIGDIFARMAPVLIIYTEYANMYQAGLEYYNVEKKKNNRFAQVCEEQKAKSGMDLEHLLIMPVQRVPRYNLLIEDLYKNTPDDHVDKVDLKTALEKTQNIANKINDCMRQTAKVRELTQIASKTAGLASLLEAHRKLIRDSVVTVTRKGVGKPAEIDKQTYSTQTEKMHLILFNDLLLYTPKSKLDKSPDPMKHGQKVPLHLVWLTQNRSANQFDMYVPGFLFTLQFDEKKQMGEASGWVNDLTKALDDHLTRYWKDKMEGEVQNTQNHLKELNLDPGLINVIESSVKVDLVERFGTYKFADGTEFEGWWKNGLPDGYGVATLNGNEYRGQFAEGVQAGIGRGNYYTGDKYLGEWAMNVPHGTGTWTTSNKDKYIGPFTYNTREGNGQILYKNGDKFDGLFSNNLPNGPGRLELHSGLQYHGDFGNGVYHGKGVLISPTGKKYSGDFVRGEKCGNGVMKYADGSYYAGRWLEDKFHGLGTFFNMADGSTYVGEFNRGVREGEGMILESTGANYSGQWKLGMRHGKGSSYWYNKESFVGNWRRNLYNGPGKLTKANGVTFEGSFENGQMSGNFQITRFGEKVKASLHPSHVSEPKMSLESPDRANPLHVEFVL